MKRVCLVVLSYFICSAAIASSSVFLIGKRQVSNSNHTHVVLFYDKAIDGLHACEKEIQRGFRGQWRYYHHKFPRKRGTSEKLNYYCIKSDLRVDGWYTKAPYDYMYQFDLRSSKPKIKKMADYSKCLKDLRRYSRNETPRFFCAKLSQKIRF